MSGFNSNSEAQVNAITANMAPPQAPVGMSAQGILSLAQGLNSNQNSILQNIGLSRDLRAKQALGQALANETNPDGSVNIQNVIAASKNNPDLAYGLSSLIPESQQANVTAQNFHQLVYDNAEKRAATFASTLQSLEENPNPTQKDVQDSVKAILDQYPDDGMMQGDALRFLQGVPQGASGDALKLYIRPYATQAMGALQQLQTQLGSTGFVNTGATQQQIAPNGVTGQVAPTGVALGNSMSPEAAGGLVQITLPNGQKQMVTQAQADQMAGQGGVVAPSQMTPGAPAVPPAGGVAPQPGDLAPLVGPLPPGDVVPQGTPVPQGFNVNNPASVAATVAGQAAGGQAPGAQASAGGGSIGFPAAPAPNAQAAIDANAGSLGKTLKTLNNSIPVQQKVMDTQQEVMDLLSTVKTGGGASTRAAIAQDLQKITGGAVPQSTVDAIAGGGQAATQTLIKLLNANVVNQFQAAGLGHNDEFTALAGANPDIDKVAGVFENLYNTQANNLAYDQAQQAFYQAHANDPGNVPEAWGKYAEANNLTPKNAGSWASVNSPTSKIGGATRLLQLAQQGNTGAQALINALKAHPDVAITAGNGATYKYDPSIDQIVVTPAQSAPTGGQ
jgi:hypothetical protein